jgi:hypothetical protein
VLQVGELAVAVGACEHPGHDTGVDPQPSLEVRDATFAQHARPFAELLLELDQVLVVGLGHPLGAAAPEPRQGERACAHRVRRAQHRVEQPAPLVRGRRVEHAAAPCEHGGDALELERVAHPLGVLVRPHQHRDVRRPHRSVRPVGPRSHTITRPALDGEPRVFEQQVAHLGDQVRLDGGADLARLEQLTLLGAGQRGVDGEAQRDGGPGLAGGVAQAPVAVCRCRGDVAERDGVVAEGGAAQQRRRGVEQCAVGAPVGGERRRPATRGAHGSQVRVHVRAPEGVDRLFRVPDQHQGRVGVLGVGEHRAEDVPLHRVGVLELVDQRDPEPVLQGRGAARRLERVAQVDEHVVEADRRGGPPTLAHPLDRPFDQLDHEQVRGVRQSLLVHAGRQAQVRDVDGGPGAQDQRRELGQLLVAQCGGGEHVGAALRGQLRGVVDHRGVGIGAGLDPERGTHLRGEAVDGGDRRRVELGDRPGKARQALLAIGRGQMHQQLVVGVTAVLQVVRGLHQPVPHAGAQLGGGGAV